MFETILQNKADAIVDYTNFDPSMLADAAIFGGAMVLIGMATIFAVLILLWGCLALFNVVFAKSKDKKPTKVESVETAPVAVPVQTSSSDEIVAVIAAAIAMAESESNGLKFKVVSFKRK